LDAAATLGPGRALALTCESAGLEIGFDPSDARLRGWRRTRSFVAMKTVTSPLWQCQDLRYGARVFFAPAP